MEDDRFLKDFAREPRPGFARALRERLRAGEERDRDQARGFAFRPAFAVAAAVLVVAAAFTVPAVRVSAQMLLDMFRVRNFAAVPFDATRFEKLKTLEGDHAMLVFEPQVLQDPTKQTVSSTGEASALAGMPVRTIADVPSGYAADPIEVAGEGRVRLIADAQRLRAVLETLGLHDVPVPPGVDGQPVEVHLWPVVSQRWKSENGGVLSLVQSRSPEVGMPSGVDLRQLGELGLRVLGLDAGEARRVAGTIDWQSTLVVPVPVGASEFREVTVRGSKGLLVTVQRPRETGKGTRESSVLMWTENDQVFALAGTRSQVQIMTIAESLR